MSGTIVGFALWCMFGCFFIGLSIYCLFSKKPMGFWANTEVFEVTDVKKYNTAVAKLFFIFGIVFILLGLPLLSKTMTLLIFLSIIGVMIETITTMIVYTLVIEKKYKKN